MTPKLVIKVIKAEESAPEFSKGRPDSCVICTKKLPRKRSRSGSLLNEQLNVLFFLNYFCKHPLLSQEGIEPDLLLQTQGNPTEWVWFCSKCLSYVDQGRQLHFQLTKCQKELDALRKVVENTVSSSFDDRNRKSKSMGAAGRSVCDAVRATLKKSVNCPVKVDFADLHINVERKNQFESVGNVRNFEEESESHQSFEDEDMGEFGILPETLDDADQVLKSDSSCWNESGTARNLRQRKQPQKIETATDGSDEEDKLFELSEEDSHDEDFEDDDASFHCSESSESGDESDSDEYDPKEGTESGTPGVRKRQDDAESVARRTCPVCGRVVRRRSEMLIHLNVKHEKKLLFFCEEETCKKGFTCKDYLREHARVHMSEEDRMKVLIRKSRKFHDSNGELHAPYGLTERGVPRVKKRLTDAENLERRTCPICSLVVRRPSEMLIHLNVKHEKKLLFFCKVETCKKGFTRKYYLKEHARVHMSEEDRMKVLTRKSRKFHDSNGELHAPYGLTERGVPRVKKRLTDAENLERRTCPVCSLVLRKPSEMLIHLNVKHEKKLLFFCEEETCKKGFTCKYYLKEHARVHMSEEDRIKFPRRNKETGKLPANEKQRENCMEFKCPNCDQCFKKEYRMKEHLHSVHLKTGGFHCKICEKSFIWKATYTDHLKFHENGDLPIKRFKCSIEPCTATFTTKKALRLHEGIHTGTKDHLCTVCGKSFRHKWTLDNHMFCKHPATLEDTKPKFICEMCGKEFFLKKSLGQHLRSKSHGGNGFPKYGKDKYASLRNIIPNSSSITSTNVTEAGTSTNTTHVEYDKFTTDFSNTTPHPFFNQSNFSEPVFHNL